MTDGPEVKSPFRELLARMDAIETELKRAAAAGERAGLTAPDEPSGERWDGGQVWAHMAEFVPYWIAESRNVLDRKAPEPVPFGRVKTDAGRIEAIARRRAEAVGVLAVVAAGDVRALRSFLREVDAQPGAWRRTGVHSKLGVMSVKRIVEEFLVGHLEEHLAQLGGLTGPT